MSFSFTILLIIVTSIISVYSLSNSSVLNSFLLKPYLVVHKNQYYRIFSHMFIHADWIHLFFNMYVLYIFGSTIEDVFTSDQYMYHLFPEITFWGVKKGYFHIFILYFGGGLAASLSSIVKYKNNTNYSSLGASGAVSAIVFSYMFLFPTQELTLIILPFFPLPAFVFGILFLSYEYLMDKYAKKTRVAHDAHFWGAMFGLFYTIVISPKFLFYLWNKVEQIFI